MESLSSLKVCSGEGFSLSNHFQQVITDLTFISESQYNLPPVTFVLLSGKKSLSTPVENENLLTEGLRLLIS